MAEQTGLSPEEYMECEAGNQDMNFTFIYRCANAFGVNVTELIEGYTPKLKSYTLTRVGDGQKVSQAHGMVALDGEDCIFYAIVLNPEGTAEAWRDGYYHTGDLAWRDEDGFYWYYGRMDDVIKSSGYRIGPFEIESVIMELPYVLECGVSAAPDPVRGQIVKASIVLIDGRTGDEDLVKEIQNYVKEHTAPYKYPRMVVFRDSLPKTVSGKIKRNLL